MLGPYEAFEGILTRCSSAGAFNWTHLTNNLRASPSKGCYTLQSEFRIDII
jgi:hypothetical protein